MVLSRAVVLEEYQLVWAEHAGKEIARVKLACSRRIAAIEHFGATSIPLVAARPVIDLMALVHKPELIAECEPLLATLGYKRIEPAPRPCLAAMRCAGSAPMRGLSFELHLYDATFTEWALNGLFRDTLRTRLSLAQAFAELKRNMATAYPDDDGPYETAKHRFIENVLEEARYRR